MDIKRSILSLITGAALIAPAAAFADHDEDRERWNEHRHTGSCNHSPVPAPPPYARPGRYEIRTVQTWVEGRYVRDWVPGWCAHKHHGKLKCRGGQYVERWVPGRYEQVDKWVWVPYPPRRGWYVSLRN